MSTKRTLPPGAPPRPAAPKGVEPVLRRSDGHRQHWRWRFAVRWTDPTTKKRKVEEFDTVGEAEDFRAHLRLARRRDALGDLTRGERTLTDFVEREWWPNYAAKELQRNTLETYAPVWNKHLHPRLGQLQLRQITPPVVHEFKTAAIDDGVGQPTVRRAMAILQSICRHATVLGELKVNPVREVPKPPVTRQLAVVAISPGQVEQLRAVFLDGYTEQRTKGNRMIEIKHGPDPVGAALVSLFAYEGLRPEEALGLEYHHLRKATLLLEQKNIDGELVAGQKTGRRRARTTRSPTLYTPVRQDLATLRPLSIVPADDAPRAPTSALPTALLFPRPGDGQPWRAHDYKNWRNRVFKPAVAAAGLPISRPYDLRHACASLMLHAGKPLTEIAEHLGHSVSTLSEYYAHLIADLRDVEPVGVEQQIINARAKRQEETG